MYLSGGSGAARPPAHTRHQISYSHVHVGLLLVVTVLTPESELAVVVDVPNRVFVLRHGDVKGVIEARVRQAQATPVACGYHLNVTHGGRVRGGVAGELDVERNVDDGEGTGPKSGIGNWPKAGGTEVRRTSKVGGGKMKYTSSK